MEVIPAIDLRGGKCVRFYQGDYSRETVYSDEPVEVAARWVQEGAKRIHVVDLDGAKSGAPANLAVVSEIVSSGLAAVQFGGGIRTVDAAKAVISMGVDRVVVGTAAVEDPSLVRDICAELGPDALVVSVDARDGFVAVRGWTEGSEVHAADLVARMEGMGVGRFMYTDIARDGTLTEPNYHAIEALADGSASRLIVAGGISSVQHLLKLTDLRVEAAIVGTALYTGDIHLGAALEAIRDSVR